MRIKINTSYTSQPVSVWYFWHMCAIAASWTSKTKYCMALCYLLGTSSLFYSIKCKCFYIPWKRLSCFTEVQLSKYLKDISVKEKQLIGLLTAPTLACLVRPPASLSPWSQDTPIPVQVLSPHLTTSISNVTICHCFFYYTKRSMRAGTVFYSSLYP